jgi:hypothetical protein
MTVTGLETGASWQWSSNSGSSWNTGSGASFTLPAGTYAAGTVRVRQIDLAGNTGPTAQNVSQVVVDTSVATPLLSLASDTGSSGADGVTTIGTINVGGLEPGASWEWTADGGTSWNTGSGASFTLPAGTYAAGTVRARQVDVAGNTATGQNAGPLVIDTTLPAAPGLAVLRLSRVRRLALRFWLDRSQLSTN